MLFERYENNKEKHNWIGYDNNKDKHKKKKIGKHQIAGFSQGGVDCSDGGIPTLVNC